MITKEANVVMLPSENNPALYINEYEWERGTATDLVVKPVTWNTLHSNTGQHLYFTNDEEIKVQQDWAIFNNIRLIKPNSYAKGRYYYLGRPYIEEVCKKVIVTTDGSINIPKVIMIGDALVAGANGKLPIPSGAFIEKYCIKRGIDKVMLEYQWIGARCVLCGFGKESNECINKKECPEKYFGGKEMLKINNHNVVSTHSIKTTWNTEEVERIRITAFEAGRKLTEDNWEDTDRADYEQHQREY